MTIDEYHSKVAEVNVQGTERAEEQVSIEYVSLIKAENLFQVTKRAEQNKHTKRNILFQVIYQTRVRVFDRGFQTPRNR